MKGIYQYKDLETDEIVYIGKDSHIDKNHRHKTHLRPYNYDDQPFNRVIQNNPERYEYSVLYCSDDVSEDDLNILEISFIERYDPRFNFTKGGEGCTGYKHTDEYKKALSKRMKGNKYRLGYKHSEESKQKISDRHKGKTLSDEHKQKIGEANKGKIRSEETKLKISKSTNNSGYFHVYKEKAKTCNQGFIWVYCYYDKDKKQKRIRSISLNKLKEKVLAKNLPWRKLE